MVHCNYWNETRMHSILSPLLFAVIIHWVMKTALTGLDMDLQWTPGSC